MKVLQIFGGEKKPTMGYIYKGIDRAKEAIAKSFGHKEENYEMTFKFIKCKTRMPTLSTFACSQAFLKSKNLLFKPRHSGL